MKKATILLSIFVVLVGDLDP